MHATSSYKTSGCLFFQNKYYYCLEKQPQNTAYHCSRNKSRLVVFAGKHYANGWYINYADLMSIGAGAG